MTTSHRQKVVILGGGYAGALAAARLAQKDLPVQITLVDASEYFVERIRLHQMATGQRVALRPMTAVLPREATYRHGRVVAVDTASQAVTLETPTGRETLGYDWLIYALGSTVDTQAVPGIAQHAHSLSGPWAAERLHAALQAQATQSAPPTPQVWGEPGRQGRVLVIGGGLTGIETVTEIAERFPTLQVELLTAGTLGADLSAAGAAHVRQVMQRLGIQLREGARVTRLTEGETHLANGSAIPFDVAVWTSGFRVSQIAAAAGLPVNHRGQIVTDRTLRAVGHATIFAVGDAAEAYGVGDDPLRMACATATPMAVHAAETLARLVRGETPEAFRFGYAIRCISLGRHDALVQSVDSADRPLPRITTGRRAALIKEGICLFVANSILLERNLRRPIYYWPQPAVKQQAEGSLAAAR